MRSLTAMLGLPSVSRFEPLLTEVLSFLWAAFGGVQCRGPEKLSVQFIPK